MNAIRLLLLLFLWALPLHAQQGLRLSSAGLVGRVGTPTYVPVDVVVDWNNGTIGNLLAVSNATNSSHGNPGVWSLRYGAIQHTYLGTGAPARRIPVSTGGVLYSGASGRYIKFDLTAAAAGSQTHEGVTMAVPNFAVLNANNVSISFLIQFGATVGAQSSVSHDWAVILASGNYAAFQQNRTSAQNVMRVETQVSGGTVRGPDKTITSGTWYQAHLRLSGTNSRAELVIVDLSGNVVLASGRNNTHATGAVYQIDLQDYLAPIGGGETYIGQVDMAWTNTAFPLEPITPPTPTSVVAAQSASNTNTVTWSGIGLKYLIERYNAGAWTVLAAAQVDAAANSYVDATCVDGQTYQYRVTSIVGDYYSLAGSSNSVVVANTIPAGFIWQQQIAVTNNDESFIQNNRVNAQQIKGIHTSGIRVVKIAMKIGSSVLTAGNLQLTLTSDKEGLGTVYGSSVIYPITSANINSEFEFSFYTANIPANTDFWIHVAPGTGTQCYLKANYTDPYLNGQGYNGWFNGPKLSGIDQDFFFKIYTE